MKKLNNSYSSGARATLVESVKIKMNKVLISLQSQLLDKTRTGVIPDTGIGRFLIKPYYTAKDVQVMHVHELELFIAEAIEEMLTSSGLYENITKEQLKSEFTAMVLMCSDIYNAELPFINNTLLLSGLPIVVTESTDQRVLGKVFIGLSRVTDSAGDKPIKDTNSFPLLAVLTVTYL